jgi:hypothetical protein
MKQPPNFARTILRGLGALSISCKEAARLQSAALDRHLGSFEKFGLRCHLVLCKWCRRYGGQIKFLGVAAQKHAEDDKCLPATRLSIEARDRIKQRLQSEME